MNNHVFQKLALASFVTFLPFTTVATVAQDSAAPQIPTQAAVPTTATVSLDGAAYNRFDVTLQAVSDQAHVLIIAEGTPLNPSLSAQQLEALRRAVPEGQPMSAGDAIKSIALAYDYEAQQTDTDTFLLRKRYSDANDLPCVTFEEVFSSLREIRKVLEGDAADNTSVALDNDVTIAEFVDSLTPAQRQRSQMPDPNPTPFTHVITQPAEAVDAGIALSELSPAQQELGMTLLKGLDKRLETIDLIVQRYFTTLESGTPDFRWVDKTFRGSEVRALGVQGAFGAGGKQEGLPFSSPFRIEFSINTHYTKVPARELTPIDLLAPTAQDRALASGMMANRLPTTLTLQEAARNAAAMLPSRSITDSQTAAGANATTRATAVKAVADKPVNVFGMRYGRDVRHLMQSLADLYGLQLLVPKQNDYALALPEHHAIDNPKDFPKELQRLTPLPLRRAFVGQKASIAASIEASPEEMARVTKRIPEGMSEDAAQRRRKSAITAIAQSRVYDTFYFPAARRLLALTEPKIPGPNAPPVPVRALAPEADRLLALMMLSDLGMGELQELQSFVPPLSLTQPDTARFQVFHKESPGSRSYSVTINHIAPDGRPVLDGNYSSNSHFEVPPTSPR